MAGLLLAAFLSMAVALPGRCGHQQSQNFSVPRIPLRRDPPPGRGLTRSDGWSPIRMKAYYGPLAVSADMEPRLRGAVDGAINWFQSFLSVKAISQPWKATVSSCNDIQLSGPILTDSLSLDYAFYIVADEADNGLAGYALYCQQDDTTSQPVLGVYYFNGGVHNQSSDEAVLSTTIHEMTHALVFSSELYTEYVKPDGTKYSQSEIYVTETVRGMSKLKLGFPTVLAKAQAGFACDSLNGVELESDGGGGSAGVHWEKRVMNNDYMVADSDINDIAYTDVTMALFKDSGWYDVDFKYSTVMKWGYKEGCGFITQKCIVNSQPITTDFCVDPPSNEQRMCDFQHLRKGTCNLSSSSETLPLEYQYFRDQTEGGADTYLDYCPVVKPYSNGDCRDPLTVLLSEDYAEEAGYQSRCITGTYSKSGSQQEHSACHVVACSATSASITIGDIVVECPFTGGDVEVDGLSGVVHCPSSDVLCRDKPCVNNCYGYGYCQNSVCICDDGTDSCQAGFTASVSATGLTRVRVVLAVVIWGGI